MAVVVQRTSKGQSWQPWHLELTFEGPLAVSHPPETTVDTTSRPLNAVNGSRKNDDVENLTKWRRPLFYVRTPRILSHIPTAPATLMHLPRPACQT